MTIRLVNLGRADKGDGDPLRVAFDKINQNFSYLTSQDGLQGIQGIQGRQGIQGFQSVQGIQGSQGLQGISDQSNLTFDFGTIMPKVITTPIELLFYTSQIDMGTINSPTPVLYDAGTLG